MIREPGQRVAGEADRGRAVLAGVMEGAGAQEIELGPVDWIRAPHRGGPIEFVGYGPNVEPPFIDGCA